MAQLIKQGGDIQDRPECVANLPTVAVGPELGRVPRLWSEWDIQGHWTGQRG